MSAHSFEARSTTRPQRKYAGVAIDVDVSDGIPLYAVRVLHDDGDQERTVAVTADEGGAVRVWNLLARMLGAQRFVACAEGGYRVVPTSGALVMRTMQPRRGRRVVLRRRPASRQRVGTAIANACHTGEREIIART